MKPKKYLSALVIAALVLVSCVSCAEIPAEQMQTGPSSTAAEITVFTEPAEATKSSTEPPVLTEPTEGPNLLGIEAGTYQSKFVDDNSKDYLDLYTFVPENAVKNMPLIVFLHGDGEIGKPYLLENIALVDNAKEIYGEDYPFIAIAPCKRQKSWCEGQVPRTVIALIEDTITQYEIDPERVIITGFSSGAMGTWYMITNHTDLFSAAVPISCPNEYPVLYNNLKEIPIWGFVGEKEEYYTQKMAEIINWTAEIGGDAKLTVLEDMSHQGMDKAAYTKEVIDWMLEQ